MIKILSLLLFLPLSLFADPAQRLLSDWAHLESPERYDYSHLPLPFEHDTSIRAQIQFKDHSPFARKRIRRESWNLVGKGLEYDFSNGLFAEAFGDYLYTQLHYSGVQRNLSKHNERGLIVGGGLGFSY